MIVCVLNRSFSIVQGLKCEIEMIIVYLGMKSDSMIVCVPNLKFWYCSGTKL